MTNPVQEPRPVGLQELHPAARLISLDAMRGFTIAAMILVNFPGSDHTYEPLEHAAWHGLTPTDLIYPFFLFIVGISIVLAYTRRLQDDRPKGDLYKKILIRSLKIFAVGVLLSLIHDFNFSEVRWAGVLQRIALVFMACAFLFLLTKPRTQAWIGAGILVAYWLLMTLVPTPGTGKVLLEPGQNLAAWVDSLLLPGKMWQGTWDPEGILSTFPAVVSGISGLLAGHLLLSSRTPKDKVIYLMIGGMFSLILGYVWSLTFPVNKNLWTSSYVLVSSGMAAMVLGTVYYMVDIRGYRQGTRVGIIFGANAIAVYVLADLLAILFYGIPIGAKTLNIHVTDMLTSMGFAPKLASMLYALLFVRINFIPAYILYNKKIFIKL
jgi:predicted acyltransferase